MTCNFSRTIFLVRSQKEPLEELNLKSFNMMTPRFSLILVSDLSGSQSLSG